MDSTTSVVAMRGEKNSWSSRKSNPEFSVTQPVTERLYWWAIPASLRPSDVVHANIRRISCVVYGVIIETALDLIYGLEAYSYEGKQKIFSGICVKTKRKLIFPQMNV
jgi:hypothetical protein